MSAAPTRIGLAGAGWVTEHHLDAYRTLPDRAVVVAIADPVRQKAAARAEHYGIPSVYGSVEKMLEAERLDAIDIAAPREHHVPLCRLAARHGLAILCQKPLAPTLAEAEELVAELAGAAGEKTGAAPGSSEGAAAASRRRAGRPAGAPRQTRLMVHENWRFRPHYRHAHAWIREGRIGTLRSAAMSVLTSGLLPDENGRLPALERQPMLAGLQRMLLMEVMIHHLDTLRFLLGPLRLEEARLEKRCEQIRGEDRATLSLTTAGGAPVSLVGDFMAHGQPPELKDRLEILGSDGSIMLQDDVLKLLAEGDRPEREAPRGARGRDEGRHRAIETTVEVDLQTDYKESFRAAIAHFLDRLTDGGPFETSPDDNLETLRIVEAAYQTGSVG